MYKIRPGYKRLSAYHIEDADFDVKLDANERAYNLPARVKQEVLARLAKVAFHRYPVSTNTLCKLIADSVNVTADQVLIGNGSSELLAAVCQVFGGCQAIAFPQPSFSMYETYALLADSQAIPVELEPDYTLSIEKMIAAAKQANLVILCNPNNPTGTGMSLADIEKIVMAVNCPVIVDEAYMEFFGQTAIPLLEKYPNVMVARTFSKAYGLASARIGYLLGSSELLELVGKALMPYHINSLSLTTAEAVFSLRGEYQTSIQETIAEREKLFAALQANDKIAVYPSQANFLFFKVVPLAQITAATLAAKLAKQGIAVRGFSSSLLTDGIRVTIGTPEENQAFLKELGKILTNSQERGEQDA